MAVDPDDAAVLACALANATDLVISGHAYLLTLKQFHQTKIVARREVIAHVTS